MEAEREVMGEFRYRRWVSTVNLVISGFMAAGGLFVFAMAVMAQLGLVPVKGELSTLEILAGTGSGATLFVGIFCYCFLLRRSCAFRSPASFTGAGGGARCQPIGTRSSSCGCGQWVTATTGGCSAEQTQRKAFSGLSYRGPMDLTQTTPRCATRWSNEQVLRGPCVGGSHGGSGGGSRRDWKREVNLPASSDTDRDNTPCPPLCSACSRWWASSWPSS